MSFSLACVLCPSFVRLLFCSLSLLAQLSWAVFPGSLWRLPVLPLGSVLHAGALVLEAGGGSATANLAHGHVCALAIHSLGHFAGLLCPTLGWCVLGLMAQPRLGFLFHAQAALAFSCPGARHSPAIARLAFSRHCARRFPAICCSGAQASWRLVAGGLRSPVIGAPRRAAALWRLATPGAQGSPAMGRSDDQPPWCSAALALTHSGAQLLRVSSLPWSSAV